MGKFVKYKTGTGYNFHLKASNGEPIGTSQVYVSKDGCDIEINSVKVNAPIANIEDQTITGYTKEKHPKFEIYVDAASQYRFRLKATNGDNILASEGYVEKDSCKDGIASVRANAPTATIEKSFYNL